MLRRIDTILDKITMYRLVVYELAALLLAAFVLSVFGLMSFGPLQLVYSVVLIFAFSWLVNYVFSFFFDAPYNPESTWITALILALLVTPPHSFLDGTYLPLALWATAWAISSKYIFAIRKKHLFNPAAFGVAVTGVVLGLSASWWVGTPAMLPFVLAGGLLIVHKIRRFDLWWAFMATFFVGIVYTGITSGMLVRTFEQSFIYAPVFFFATVMLTEPLTSPPTRYLRIVYGAFVAFLFLPNTHIGSYYFAPETALLVGNLFSYLVSPKVKAVLRLKEKIRLSKDVYEFVFQTDKKIKFRPGQYLEWTLAHPSPDSRSVRRYFTIASSPYEEDIRLGVKFYSPASSFKRALFSMRPGDPLVASQLAGDFTLPRSKKRPIVLIAGGIGVTPFRSHIQYLLDKGEKRPVTVLYAARSPQDAVYRGMLQRAERELGIKTVYAFSEVEAGSLPPGCVNRLDARVIANVVPDYRHSTFYISGPQGMVVAFKDILAEMGVGRRHIRTDYFPGFA